MLLTDKQVAARLSIGKSTVWRWLDHGRLPQPVKLSPGCTRWREQDIADLINQASA